MCVCVCVCACVRVVYAHLLYRYNILIVNSRYFVRVSYFYLLGCEIPIRHLQSMP